MDSHPNIGHWDDVPWRRIDRGELQGERRRLGPAVGTAAVGLSRYRLGPGERAMPAHVHADEEELCFVLSGGGLAWLDGATHELRAGDAMVHRANAEAHTWVAGPEGIDLLIFGEGSSTNMTYLPRAQAWWMGPRWLPADGPNPFVLEAAAGPLELPDPTPRPASIRNLDELPLEAEVRGRFGWHMHDLGRGTGSVSSGLRHDRLEEGQWTCPSHWHSSEEELFVVLDGAGEVELGEQERYPLRAGSIVARPPATGIGHALVAGPGGMTYLAYGTRRPHDVCHYPRANKVAFAGGPTFRISPVDYYDGED